MFPTDNMTVIVLGRKGVHGTACVRLIRRSIPQMSSCSWTCKWCGLVLKHRGFSVSCGSKRQTFSLPMKHTVSGFVQFVNRVCIQRSWSKHQCLLNACKLSQARGESLSHRIPAVLTFSKGEEFLTRLWPSRGHALRTFPFQSFCCASIWHPYLSLLVHDLLALWSALTWFDGLTTDHVVRFEQKHTINGLLASQTEMSCGERLSARKQWGRKCAFQYEWCGQQFDARGFTRTECRKSQKSSYSSDSELNGRDIECQRHWA